MKSQLESNVIVLGLYYNELFPIPNITVITLICCKSITALTSIQFP